MMPAHALVLATCSAFLRTHLETELGTPLRDAQGRRLLALEVEDEEHLAAAELVLQMMYSEHVPEPCLGNSPQLALACRVADRWACPQCLSLAFAALASLSDEQLSAEVLARVLPRLPCFTGSSVRDLPQFGSFTTRVVGVLVDVHAVLTTPPLLQLLLQLPAAAMLVWAGMDDLVVDSENSVVVALDCWVRDGVGGQCSRDELLQVSSLVRVKHLTPSCQLRLLRLPWWHHDKDLTEQFVAAACLHATAGWDDAFPAAWLKEPRQQLPTDQLKQRSKLEWDVPRAELEAALAGKASTRITSLMVYVAGHGLRLSLEVGAEEAPTGREAGAHHELVLPDAADGESAGGDTDGAAPKRLIAVHLHAGSYASIFAAGNDALVVVPEGAGALVVSSFSLCVVTAEDPWHRTLAGGADQRVLLVKGGLGKRDAFSAATVADLEPHLVDGHLKLRAEVEVVR